MSTSNDEPRRITTEMWLAELRPGLHEVVNELLDRIGKPPLPPLDGFQGWGQISPLAGHDIAAAGAVAHVVLALSKEVDALRLEVAALRQER